MTTSPAMIVDKISPFGKHRMLYIEKHKEDAEAFRKRKQGKSGIKPPDGGGEKKVGKC